MTYKKYLSGIAVAAIVSWTSWLLVVHKLSPFESTWLALALFFVSLLFALMCTLTLIGFFVRQRLNNNEIYYHHINTSLRQGILLSILINTCLFLQIFGLLSWWSGFLLVLIVTLVEFYITKEI